MYNTAATKASENSEQARNGWVPGTFPLIVGAGLSPEKPREALWDTDR
jgi:hypothetical protein